MEKVFLNVLNMSITSGYVILFVLLARIILKKAPGIFSYGLWAIVLFRLICPFTLSSTLSLFRFLKSDTMEHIPADIGYMPQPKVSLGIKTADNLVNGSLPAASQYASVNPMQIIVTAASLIWIIGIIALVAYSVVSYVLLKRRISTAMIISDNIFESENVKSPFVLGLISPKIYLPINLPENERGYILMHEQTHIKRFDYVIKPFAFLVMCFHWFNPFVWVSFVLMSHDMEMSCDESVLNRMGKNIKKDYSNSLLTLAAHKRMINGSPLTFGESNVKGRIKNVLNYKKPGFWVIAAAVILVMVFSIGLITNPKNNKQNLTSFNINSVEKDKVSTSTTTGIRYQKVYEIPSKLRKETYSVDDFKTLYSEYLKLNNIQLQTSPENDKTGMTPEAKLKYYTIYEIAPQNIKKEIKCQLFKVNYTCETYLVYNAKVYSIGLGFGGYGVVNIETCDFDDNGQKDLIYTFSWGSGMHRSQIGVFNFTSEHEQWLDFQQMNEDIMLEKVSDNNFKVYTVGVSAENLDFTHVKLSKRVYVAYVKNTEGKIEVIRFIN